MAVEPNAAMRAAAEPHPRVIWHDGSAEASGLAPGSVDLVLCAQAFHWFRQHEAVKEFHGILRPGGRLALMWNNRDGRDPFTRDYIAAIRAVNGDSPIERREFDPSVIHRHGWFTEATLATFENQQPLSLEALIGRATSASYVPRGGRLFEVLSESLAALLERHRDAGGQVRMKYVTTVYLAGRR
jgi:SAM-dependent methyltransferase